MPTVLRLPLATALLLAACAAYSAAVPRHSASYPDLPMHFEANRGQADPAVRFTAQGAGYSVYLTPRESVLVLDAPNDAQQPETSVALRMRLVGARGSPAVAGLEELP